MSLDGGISGSGQPWVPARVGAFGSGTPSTAGQQPGGAAVPPQRIDVSRLGSTFHSTFQAATATVLDIAAGGGFEDQRLLAKEQQLLDRLRHAAALNGGDVNGGGPGAPAVRGGGAQIIGGANAGPGPVHGPAVDVDATSRELLEVRAAQAEARLGNVHTSLAERYPDAAQIASASVGGYDPARFQPPRGEDPHVYAKRLAQRMVVDLTEGAAQLELLKTKLDLARLDAGASGTSPQVAELQARYDRQVAYVDRLATAVDGTTQGAVTDAGEDALAGSSMRDADDAPVDALAAELRAAGLDEASIVAVTGASELAVEEEATPGGSRRIDAAVSASTEAFIRMADEFVRQMREDSKKDAQRRREDDARAEVRYADEKAIARATEQRAIHDQIANQAAAQRRADATRPRP